MGPTKREQIVEDADGILTWQIKLETKRDINVRELALFILKLLKDIIEYKCL